jgi:RNA polymerase sigma factor (TIGR02999 family)
MPDASVKDDVTGLLLEWRNGDQEALNRLIPLVYDELHRLAARQLRRERATQTLQSTALVHEAYLRLVDQRRVQWHDRDHFFAVASQLIRRILVSHARRRKALKRGGAQTTLVLDESIATPRRRGVDLEALDDALESLARLDQQQARIVELRFFGGLSIESTANFLRISPATVKRHWNVAKAWLYREISRHRTSEA